MKGVYKQKRYHDLINIITSRTKVLDDGVTGIKPFNHNDNGNILKQIDKKLEHNLENWWIYRKHEI